MNSTITDLSAALTAQLSGGSGSARASFGAKTQAFAWAGPTLNAAIAAVTPAVAQSRNFTAVRVAKTNAVVSIPDGTNKPVTAILDSVPVTLKTYPGVCEIKTSDIVDSANLGQAVNQALYFQALHALDNELVTALIADSRELDDAPSLSSIAGAQAMIMAAGGYGDLVILSATDYATIIGGSSGLVQGGNDPRQAQQFVFGAQITVSSSLADGEAIVMDRTAALAIELDASPVALVDVHARLNTTDVVIEVIGGALVTRPDSVVFVKSVTP